NVAQTRSQELGGQARNLEGQLAGHQRAFEKSRARYEEQAEAAYKGKDLEGVTAVLGGVLGAEGNVGMLADDRIARILSEGRQSLDEYRGSRQKLENTVRQVSRKKSAYNDSVEEERRRAEELRQHEQRLETAVSRIRADKSRTDYRIQRLRKAERTRILKTSPATGGPAVQRQRELRIARQDIVAQPVRPISKKQYKRLYEKSAKKYGFREDWHILAAVGKVESNHGKNMGPSSAGALGPMQFMPSTWETSGVDGNGDGVANVMDPRDAIPAAARYLKAGGAPDEDWYAALFSYNHADWYVKKVLGVAEGYRRLADDDRVGPYT
ncbi:MAG: lytic transglycosylase domain-containing protein, partial [Actinomycetota bacterium]|nr:lytic transglycosylase domain-containing protein [Actinomycetota bacterium]